MGGIRLNSTRPRVHRKQPWHEKCNKRLYLRARGHNPGNAEHVMCRKGACIVDGKEWTYPGPSVRLVFPSLAFSFPPSEHCHLPVLTTALLRLCYAGPQDTRRSTSSGRASAPRRESPSLSRATMRIAIDVLRRIDFNPSAQARWTRGREHRGGTAGQR